MLCIKGNALFPATFEAKNCKVQIVTWHRTSSFSKKQIFFIENVTTLLLKVFQMHICIRGRP